MSVEEPRIATSSQTVGPFFHFGLTAQPRGRMADRLPADLERIRLRIRVTDGDEQPVSDAMVELWQAGVFGRLPTSAEGWCEFETALPRPHREGIAPHINVCLFARGLLRQLHTRIYFEADPTLETDAVLALVPEDRRSTLIARRDSAAADLWLFDMHLQGPRETVFFDA